MLFVAIAIGGIGIELITTQRRFTLLRILSVVTGLVMLVSITAIVLAAITFLIKIVVSAFADGPIVGTLVTLFLLALLA